LLQLKFFNNNLIKKIILLSEIGEWFGKNKCKNIHTRYELYNFIFNNHIASPINYLEFGVYKGDSIKKWIEIDKNMNSRFYGFDTFEGLPEDWSKIKNKLSKGTFSTGGNFPNILDSRVRFIKGLFQESLESFLLDFKRTDQLVIHLDADLYSSTLYVLTKLDPILTEGDILIFDEFTSGDEYLALKNYQDAFRKKIELIAKAGKSFQHVAVKIK